MAITESEKPAQEKFTSSIELRRAPPHKGIIATYAQLLKRFPSIITAVSSVKSGVVDWIISWNDGKIYVRARFAQPIEPALKTVKGSTLLTRSPNGMSRSSFPFALP
eukprot:CAMPEP_0115159052 /NCGR_PEP_ID=MMETSP0227-20121206/69966_1 /TAXON_ID=89957 /ORGANISM="Polarella glacialis, Strain CCMP 1383" /LENGTH=106 /DNA_ID=CAMNT_0002570657 /DNA_START=38 /DNA_END=355 /DNA_ORIENTATION=-